MKTLKVVLGMGCAALTVGAQAQVILTIDLSNPNAVTFAATSQNPANDASIHSLVGVTLMNFFTAPTFAPQIPQGINSVSPGLSPAGADQPVDTYYSVGANGTYTGQTLNLTGGGTLTPIWNFSTTGPQAFSGSATANFSQIDLNVLPGLGAMGDIKIGSYASFAEPSTTIGQWQVVAGTTPVPEPAAVGLAAGLALGGFAFARRRMKKD